MKYNAKRTIRNGIPFDSKVEARRYEFLLMMERAGEISQLKRQVEFELIPDQREASTECYTRGEKKGQPKEGKLIERKISYIADFVYFRNGKKVIEDVKGFKGGKAYSIFVIKRKLLLWRYGLRITEITNPREF